MTNVELPVTLGVTLLTLAISYMVGRLAQAAAGIRQPKAIHLTSAPLLGISLLALQLWLYGLIHLPWNAWALTLPWLGAWAAHALLNSKKTALRHYVSAEISSIHKLRVIWQGHDSLSRSLVVSAGIITAIYLLQLATQPVLSSDVFLIWGLKAKEFFAHQAVYVSRQFYEGEVMSRMAHVDYPPMAPLITDVAYTLYGQVNESLLKCVSLIYMLCGVASAYAYLRSNELSGKGSHVGVMPATAACFVILAAPQFSPFLFDGRYMAYADYGLAMIFLVGSIFLLRSLSSARPNSDWLLAFYFAALAANYKNEGLCFLAAVSLVLGYRLIRYALTGRPAASYVLRALLLAVTILIPVAAWAVFKHAYDMSSDFKLANIAQSGMTVSERLQITLSEAKSYIIGSQALLWQAAGLLIGTVAALYSRSRSALIVLFIIVIQLCGYLASYVLSPFNIPYHISASFDRLLAQILPLVVLLLASNLANVSYRIPAPGHRGR